MIELLNLTVKELHEKYIKDEIPGINFEKDLIQIEKNMEQTIKKNMKIQRQN